MRRPGKVDIPYIGLVGAAFALAVFVAAFAGSQIDNAAYDWMFRFYRPAPWQTETILLAVDEDSLSQFGGLRNLRAPLAEGLERIAAAKPKAVAVDLILADPGDGADARLENAFALTRNLVLACQLKSDGARWEDPLPRFARHAAAIGHVHAEPDRLDAVGRALPLEKQTRTGRHWALALEAYRVSRGATVTESPEDVQVGDVVIPARLAGGRLMRIRYVPPNMPPIPRVALRDLLADATLARRFAGRVVFVGVTAQTAVRDWLFTPYSPSVPMVGLEIHANAYETIAQRRFITDAPQGAVLGFAVLLAVAAAAAFALAPLWQAYLMAIGLLAAAHVLPYQAFTRGRVFSYALPVSSAWFTVVTAAGWQHLVVRRRLRRAEADRARYQQTMHFVTHEMRTPLTAIQGSSEMISRYGQRLPEDSWSMRFII